MKSSLEISSEVDQVCLPANQAMPWAPPEVASKPAQVKKALAEEILEIFSASNLNGSRATSKTRLVEKEILAPNTVTGWFPSEVTKSPKITRLVSPARFPHSTTSPSVEEKPDERQVLLREAQDKANQMVNEAQLQADQILLSARESANEVTEKAYNEGLERDKVELASIIEAAKTIVEQASVWRAELLAKSEATVIGMVKEISAAIFSQGLVLDGQLLQESFTKALTKARSLGNLRIYVNPKDAVYLDPAWREFQASISGQRIQVMPSESILPGGCFIDGDQGSVDARVEIGLKAILNVFDDPTPRQH